MRRHRWKKVIVAEGYLLPVVYYCERTGVLIRAIHDYGREEQWMAHVTVPRNYGYKLSRYKAILLLQHDEEEFKISWVTRKIDKMLKDKANPKGGK